MTIITTMELIIDLKQKVIIKKEDINQGEILQIKEIKNKIIIYKKKSKKIISLITIKMKIKLLKQ